MSRKQSRDNHLQSNDQKEKAINALKIQQYLSNQLGKPSNKFKSNVQQSSDIFQNVDQQAMPVQMNNYQNFTAQSLSLPQQHQKNIEKLKNKIKGIQQKQDSNIFNTKPQNKAAKVQNIFPQEKQTQYVNLNKVKNQQQHLMDIIQNQNAQHVEKQIQDEPLIKSINWFQGDREYMENQVQNNNLPFERRHLLTREGQKRQYFTPMPMGGDRNRGSPINLKQISPKQLTQSQQNFAKNNQFFKKRQQSRERSNRTSHQNIGSLLPSQDILEKRMQEQFPQEEFSQRYSNHFRQSSQGLYNGNFQIKEQDLSQQIPHLQDQYLPGQDKIQPISDPFQFQSTTPFSNWSQKKFRNDHSSNNMYDINGRRNKSNVDQSSNHINQPELIEEKYNELKKIYNKMQKSKQQIDDQKDQLNQQLMSQIEQTTQEMQDYNHRSYSNQAQFNETTKPQQEELEEYLTKNNYLPNFHSEFQQNQQQTNNGLNNNNNYQNNISYSIIVIQPSEREQQQQQIVETEQTSIANKDLMVQTPPPQTAPINIRRRQVYNQNRGQALSQENFKNSRFNEFPTKQNYYMNEPVSDDLNMFNQFNNNQKQNDYSSDALPSKEMRFKQAQNANYLKTSHRSNKSNHSKRSKSIQDLMQADKLSSYGQESLEMQNMQMLEQILKNHKLKNEYKKKKKQKRTRYQQQPIYRTNHHMVNNRQTTNNSIGSIHSNSQNNCGGSQQSTSPKRIPNFSSYVKEKLLRSEKNNSIDNINRFSMGYMDNMDEEISCQLPIQQINQESHQQILREPIIQNANFDQNNKIELNQINKEIQISENRPVITLDQQVEPKKEKQNSRTLLRKKSTGSIRLVQLNNKQQSTDKITQEIINKDIKQSSAQKSDGKTSKTKFSSPQSKKKLHQYEKSQKSSKNKLQQTSPTPKKNLNEMSPKLNRNIHDTSPTAKRRSQNSSPTTKRSILLLESSSKSKKQINNNDIQNVITSQQSKSKIQKQKESQKDIMSKSKQSSKQIQSIQQSPSQKQQSGIQDAQTKIKEVLMANQAFKNIDHTQITQQMMNILTQQIENEDKSNQKSQQSNIVRKKSSQISMNQKESQQANFKSQKSFEVNSIQKIDQSEKIYSVGSAKSGSKKGIKFKSKDKLEILAKMQSEVGKNSQQLKSLAKMNSEVKSQQKAQSLAKMNSEVKNQQKVQSLAKMQSEVKSQKQPESETKIESEQKSEQKPKNITKVESQYQNIQLIKSLSNQPSEHKSSNKTDKNELSIKSIEINKDNKDNNDNISKEFKSIKQISIKSSAKKSKQDSSDHFEIQEEKKITSQQSDTNLDISKEKEELEISQSQQQVQVQSENGDKINSSLKVKSQNSSQKNDNDSQKQLQLIDEDKQISKEEEEQVLESKQQSLEQLSIKEENIFEIDNQEIIKEKQSIQSSQKSSKNQQKIESLKQSIEQKQEQKSLATPKQTFKEEDILQKLQSKIKVEMTKGGIEFVQENSKQKQSIETPPQTSLEDEIHQIPQLKIRDEMLNDKNVIPQESSIEKQSNQQELSLDDPQNKNEDLNGTEQQVVSDQTQQTLSQIEEVVIKKEQKEIQITEVDKSEIQQEEENESIQGLEESDPLLIQIQNSDIHTISTAQFAENTDKKDENNQPLHLINIQNQQDLINASPMNSYEFTLQNHKESEEYKLLIQQQSEHLQNESIVEQEQDQRQGKLLLDDNDPHIKSQSVQDEVEQLSENMEDHVKSAKSHKEDLTGQKKKEDEIVQEQTSEKLSFQQFQNDQDSLNQIESQHQQKSKSQGSNKNSFKRLKETDSQKQLLLEIEEKARQFEQQIQDSDQEFFSKVIVGSSGNSSIIDKVQLNIEEEQKVEGNTEQNESITEISKQMTFLNTDIEEVINSNYEEPNELVSKTQVKNKQDQQSQKSLEQIIVSKFDEQQPEIVEDSIQNKLQINQLKVETFGINIDQVQTNQFEKEKNNNSAQHTFGSAVSKSDESVSCPIFSVMDEENKCCKSIVEEDDQLQIIKNDINVQGSENNYRNRNATAVFGGNPFELQLYELIDEITTNQTSTKELQGRITIITMDVVNRDANSEKDQKQFKTYEEKIQLTENQEDLSMFHIDDVQRYQEDLSQQPPSSEFRFVDIQPTKSKSAYVPRKYPTISFIRPNAEEDEFDVEQEFQDHSDESIAGTVIESIQEIDCSQLIHDDNSFKHYNYIYQDKEELLKFISQNQSLIQNLKDNFISDLNQLSKLAYRINNITPTRQIGQLIAFIGYKKPTFDDFDQSPMLKKIDQMMMADSDEKEQIPFKQIQYSSPTKDKKKQVEKILINLNKNLVCIKISVKQVKNQLFPNIKRDSIKKKDKRKLIQNFAQKAAKSQLLNPDLINPDSLISNLKLQNDTIEEAPQFDDNDEILKSVQNDYLSAVQPLMNLRVGLKTNSCGVDNQLTSQNTTESIKDISLCSSSRKNSIISEICRQYDNYYFNSPNKKISFDNQNSNILLQESSWNYGHEVHIISSKQISAIEINNLMEYKLKRFLCTAQESIDNKRLYHPPFSIKGESQSDEEISSIYKKAVGDGGILQFKQLLSRNKSQPKFNDGKPAKYNYEEAQNYEELQNEYDEILDHQEQTQHKQKSEQLDKDKMKKLQECQSDHSSRVFQSTISEHSDFQTHSNYEHDIIPEQTANPLVLFMQSSLECGDAHKQNHEQIIEAKRMIQLLDGIMSESSNAQDEFSDDSSSSGKSSSESEHIDYSYLPKLEGRKSLKGGQQKNPQAPAQKQIQVICIDSEPEVNLFNIILTQFRYIDSQDIREYERLKLSNINELLLSFDIESINLVNLTKHGIKRIEAMQQKIKYQQQNRFVTKQDISDLEHYNNQIMKQKVKKIIFKSQQDLSVKFKLCNFQTDQTFIMLTQDEWIKQRLNCNRGFDIQEMILKKMESLSADKYMGNWRLQKKFFGNIQIDMEDIDMQSLDGDCEKPIYNNYHCIYKMHTNQNPNQLLDKVIQEQNMNYEIFRILAQDKLFKVKNKLKVDSNEKHNCRPLWVDQRIIQMLTIVKQQCPKYKYMDINSEYSSNYNSENSLQETAQYIYIEDLEGKEQERQERQCKQMLEIQELKDPNTKQDKYQCKNKQHSHYQINSKKLGKYEGVYGFRYGMAGFKKFQDTKHDNQDDDHSSTECLQSKSKHVHHDNMKVRLTNGILLNLDSQSNVQIPELKDMSCLCKIKILKEAKVLQSYYDNIKSTLKMKTINDQVFMELKKLQHYRGEQIDQLNHACDVKRHLQRKMYKFMKRKLRDTAVCINLFKKNMSKYVNPFQNSCSQMDILQQQNNDLPEQEMKKKIVMRKNVFNQTEEKEGQKDRTTVQQFNKPVDYEQGSKSNSFKLTTQLRSLGDKGQVDFYQQHKNELESQENKFILENKQFPLYLLFEVINVRRKTAFDINEEMKEVVEKYKKVQKMNARVANAKQLNIFEQLIDMKMKKQMNKQINIENIDEKEEEYLSQSSISHKQKLKRAHTVTPKAFPALLINRPTMKRMKQKIKNMLGSSEQNSQKSAQSGFCSIDDMILNELYDQNDKPMIKKSKTVVINKALRKSMSLSRPILQNLSDAKRKEKDMVFGKDVNLNQKIDSLKIDSNDIKNNWGHAEDGAQRITQSLQISKKEWFYQ